MLCLGSWIALLGFWFYALRLARHDSNYLSLPFISLWFVARFGIPQLGIEGPIYFISFHFIFRPTDNDNDLHRPLPP